MTGGRKVDGEQGFVISEDYNDAMCEQ